MKKKNYITLFTALLTLSATFAGCSHQNEASDYGTPAATVTPASTILPTPTIAPIATSTPTPVPVTADLNLEDVYQSILDLQTDHGLEYPIMFPASGDPYLEDFYPGVFDLEFEQEVFYVAPIAGFACEVLLLEVTNPDDIATIQNVMQARIDKGASDPYYIEEAALWTKNARIHIYGNYIGMVVLPEGYIIPENIFTDIK